MVTNDEGSKKLTAHALYNTHLRLLQSHEAFQDLTSTGRVFSSWRELTSHQLSHMRKIVKTALNLKTGLRWKYACWTSGGVGAGGRLERRRRGRAESFCECLHAGRRLVKHVHFYKSPKLSLATLQNEGNLLIPQTQKTYTLVKTLIQVFMVVPPVQMFLYTFYGAADFWHHNPRYPISLGTSKVVKRQTWCIANVMSVTASCYTYGLQPFPLQFDSLVNSRLTRQEKWLNLKALKL